MPKMIDKRQACITTHFFVASRMVIRVLLPDLISSKGKVVFFSLLEMNLISYFILSKEYKTPNSPRAMQLGN